MNLAHDKHPTPNVGSLLIAEPYSGEPYFKRSAILMVEHNENGDVGFVLSKPLSLSLPDLLDNFSRNDFIVSLGGPVAPSSLHYIHTLGDVVIPGAIHIKNNIYWGGDFDILRKFINSGDVTSSEVKFFVGYSGWTTGQLSDEIKNGDWGVTAIDDIDLMGDCRNLWYDLIERDDKYKKWLLVPENPEDN